MKQKKIVVLMNLVFYKIKKIRKEASTRKMKARRSALAQCGMKSIVMEMMIQAEIPRDVAEKAYRLAKKHKARIQRSAKSKNRHM